MFYSTLDRYGRFLILKIVAKVAYPHFLTKFGGMCGAKAKIKRAKVQLTFFSFYNSFYTIPLIL